MTAAKAALLLKILKVKSTYLLECCYATNSRFPMALEYFLARLLVRKTGSQVTVHELICADVTKTNAKPHWLITQDVVDIVVDSACFHGVFLIFYFDYICSAGLRRHTAVSLVFPPLNTTKRSSKLH